MEEITRKKRKLGKNPHVDISFLLTPKRRIGFWKLHSKSGKPSRRRSRARTLK